MLAGKENAQPLTRDWFSSVIGKDHDTNLRAYLEKEHTKTLLLSLLEVVMAMLWTIVSLPPLHDLIRLLTTRWLRYYSPAAVLIRILTSITLLFYQLGFIFRIIEWNYIHPIGSNVGQSKDLLKLPVGDRRASTLLFLWVFLTITVTFFRDLVARTSSSVQETRKASMVAPPPDTSDGFAARVTDAPPRLRKRMTPAVVIDDEPLVTMERIGWSSIGTLAIVLLGKISL